MPEHMKKDRLFQKRSLLEVMSCSRNLFEISVRQKPLKQKSLDSMHTRAHIHTGIHIQPHKDFWGLGQAWKHWQWRQVQVCYIKTCTWELGLALSLLASDPGIEKHCILFFADSWEYLNLLPKKKKNVAHTVAGRGTPSRARNWALV